jgi:hypothetical protein
MAENEQDPWLDAPLTQEEQAAVDQVVEIEARRRQAISFAFGNAVLANPAVTREMVAEEYDKRQSDYEVW